MTVRIMVGHVLDEIAKLPDESVHAIWTSVPYFGLRSYKTVHQVWGGNPPHQHEWCDATVVDSRHLPESHPTPKQATNAGAAERGIKPGAFCVCGSWRGEHGLEPSLALWLKHEVLIWRELRRVLRSDGTAWVNIGDAYASNGGAGGGMAGTGLGTPSRANEPRPEAEDGAFRRWEKDYSGLVPKQRLMLPARLALALQEDGWILRDELVWAKANPMPSSVSDRTTPAHEMLYMLAKSGEPTYWTHRDGPGTRVRRPAPDYRWIDHANDDREFHVEPEDWRTITTLDGRRRWSRLNLWSGHDYFYDGHAIRESGTESSIARLSQKTIMEQRGGPKQDAYEADGINARNGSRRPNEIVQSLARHAGNKSHKYVDEYDGSDTEEHRTKSGLMQVADVPWFSRNKRSVWPMASEPMREAHFATAPTKLVEPCILASTSAKGACSACGAPWTRRAATSYENPGNRTTNGPRSLEQRHETAGFAVRLEKTVATTGWAPTCGCNAAVVRPTVLDPFAGAFTTMLVCERLCRDSVAIELNPDYVKIGRDRLKNGVGMFFAEHSSDGVQILADAPEDARRELKAPDSPDRHLIHCDPDDAQASLWE